MIATPTSLPTVMRAVRFTKFGTPAEALVDAEVPEQDDFEERVPDD